MSSKIITSFVCQECGYDSPQWLGKCPECGTWNSMKEFHETQKSHLRQDFGGQAKLKNLESHKPKVLSEIDLKETERILTGFSEMDNVLGGGIVPGSVILLAGDPGIGKSTLLLQTALNIAGPDLDKFNNNSGIVKNSQQNRVLYISAEESAEQIKIRANRLKYNLTTQNLQLVSLSDTNEIANMLAEKRPSLAIVDSIQTMESEFVESLPGSVPQVRYAAAQFIRTAKQNNIPIILVGHVTKEGMVAGPMILSHMVDTVLFLEGDKVTSTRILRSFKNRFGPVDEVGVFRMTEDGMHELTSPEDLFLTKRAAEVSGSVLTVVMEGSRSFLVEIQALVVVSKLAMPRRVALGFDQKRLELLLAVLQKYSKLSVAFMDVFVTIAGGLQMRDPGMDLAICLAVYSSIKNIPSSQIVGIAEVGLLGELREPGSFDKRVKEAKKLGFTRVVSAKTHKTLMQALGDFPK